jgi:YD repeat-containing protein
LTSEIRLAGLTTPVQETEYNSNALPTTKWRFGQQVQSLSWRADGTLRSVADANGNTTELNSWHRGLPGEIVFADGTSSEASVNNRGEITDVTDAMGNVHTYKHDPMGRISEIGYPADDENDWAPTILSFEQSSESAYGLAKDHWQRTVTTGPQEVVTYLDARWRPVLVRTRDNTDEGGTTSYSVTAFDHNNRKTFQSFVASSAPFWDGGSSTSGWGSTVQGAYTYYDILGRVTSEVTSTSDDDYATTINYLSGKLGREVINSNGYSTTSYYQAFDRPSYDAPYRIDAPEGQQTTIDRDLFLKPLTITRTGLYDVAAPTVHRVFHYDDQHRLCAQVEPESGATVFSYDPAGNTAWQASGQSGTSACNRDAVSDSEKTFFEYDAQNRITDVVYPGSAEHVSYVYEPDGEISAINSGESTWTYLYNSRRMLRKETFYHPSSGQHNFDYAYDNIGNLEAQRYPGGLILEYQPDALGRQGRAGNYASSAEYFPDGALQSFVYGNGIVREIQRDDRQLPRRVTDAYGSSTAHDWEYLYDDVGNVTDIIDRRENGHQSQSMVYDGLNRLKEASAPGMWGVATYQYNAVDDIERAEISSGDHARVFEYQYDSQTRHLDAITDDQSEVLYSFDHDSRGNQVQRSGIGGSHERDFDAANRLLSAGDGTAYEYDGYGRRTKVTRADGSVELYIYSADGVLRQNRKLSEDAAQSFVYLAGTMVAQLDHSLGDLPPPYDMEITAPSVTASGDFTVSWVPDSERWVDGYRLEHHSGDGSWDVIQHYSRLSASQSVDFGLHSYRVSACNGDACGTTVTAVTWVAGQPSLTVPHLSDGFHEISWSAVKDAQFYELERNKDGNGWSLVYRGSQLEKAEEFIPEGGYSYRARACRSVGCGPYSDSKLVGVTYAPTEAPDIDAPATSHSGDYTVSWSNAGGYWYELQERQSGGSWSSVGPANLHDYQWSFTGRSSGHYTYRVKACNDSGCGPNSAEATIDVVLEPQSAPSNVSSPDSSSDGSYTVSWDGVENATRYQLHERRNNGSWEQIHNGSDTIKARSGLNSGSYDYRARACNDAGCSGWSSVVTTSVLHPPSTSPNLSAPSSNSTGTYIVSWNGVDGADRYQLQESFNSGSWSTIFNAFDTSVGRGSQPNGSYRYRVRACNSSGCSSWSATTTVDVLRPPATPSGLSAPSSTTAGSSFTVSWNSVGSADSYRLQRRRNGGSWSTVYSSSGTSITNTLSTSGTYDYRVRACNTSGCSSYSGTISVTVATGGGGCDPQFGCFDPMGVPEEDSTSSSDQEVEK